MPAFVEGERANIATADFQKIIGDEDDRKIGAHALRDLLPTEAALKHGKWQRTIVVPGENLSIENRSVREELSRFDEFWKCVRNHFITAGPDKRLAAATDDLRANAIPLPLNQPLGDGPQFFQAFASSHFELERRREKKWKRLGNFRCTRFAAYEPAEVIGGRLPRAHDPMRHHGRFNSRDVRERANDESSRHSDAEITRDDFVPNVTLVLIQF